MYRKKVKSQKAEVRSVMPQVISIAKIIRETPFVKTFVFKHRLNSAPGQFVNLWIPRVDEKPMSIAYDHGDEFGLTIFRVGKATEVLHAMKVGDKVGVRGPFGKPFSYKAGDHVITVGGGYGAAPLLDLAKKARAAKCRVDFVVGARSKEHLLFVERAKKVVGLKVHVATDDGSAGVKGYNTVLVEQILSGLRASERKKVVVCAVGPEMMMKKVSDMCVKYRVRCQVSLERYMKCGFGVCGNCCADDAGYPVCINGPVMDHVEARKLKEFGAYHRDAVGKKHLY